MGISDHYNSWSSSMVDWLSREHGIMVMVSVLRRNRVYNDHSGLVMSMRVMVVVVHFGSVVMVVRHS